MQHPNRTPLTAGFAKPLMQKIFWYIPGRIRSSSDESIGMSLDFCYCEFTHPFLWFKAGAAHTSVCLVRKKSRLGVMSRRKLEACRFQEEAAGSDVSPTCNEKTPALGSRRSNMEHQKNASWIVSQLSPLGASITYWIKRKLPAAQLKFHPVCSWSDSNKLGF